MSSSQPLAKSKAILVFFIVAAVLMVFLLFTLQYLGFETKDQLNIVFAYAIMVFAGLEATASYMQVVLEDTRNLIQDTRNELEKAYGPIYSLLNSHIRTYSHGNKKIALCMLNRDEKACLDGIFAAYPYMFPSEVYEYWKEHVHGLMAQGLIAGTNISIDPPFYDIPLEFKDMGNAEYELRVEKYNELLGKTTDEAPRSKKKLTNKEISILAALLDFQSDSAMSYITAVIAFAFGLFAVQSIIDQTTEVLPYALLSAVYLLLFLGGGYALLTFSHLIRVSGHIIQRMCEGTEFYNYERGRTTFEVVEQRDLTRDRRIRVRYVWKAYYWIKNKHVLGAASICYGFVILVPWILDLAEKLVKGYFIGLF